MAFVLKLLSLLCHDVYRKAKNINKIGMLSFIQKSTQTVSVYLFIETKQIFFKQKLMKSNSFMSRKIGLTFIFNDLQCRERLSERVKLLFI